MEKKSTALIKKLAIEAGFDLVGITSASFLEKEFLYFENWLREGAQAGMHFMEKNPRCRAEPRTLLPSARSLLMLGTDYFTPPGLRKKQDMEIALYARVPDYHLTLRSKMASLTEQFKTIFPDADFQPFVDTSPVLEKAFAHRAGLGFIGKNTLLINKRFGSYFFLSGILTSLELEEDSSEKKHCGSCELCIKACPTGALRHPGYLDSGRCLSYLTIENKGTIPEAFRPLLGKGVWGCDRCQRVCPYNQKRKAKRENTLYSNLNLETIFSFSSERSFRKFFEKSALLRGGRKGLVRNACIVAGNSKNPRWLPYLEYLRQNDPLALIREIADWAIQQIKIVKQEIDRRCVFQ
jgi:epoxyqueuosine reductase